MKLITTSWDDGNIADMRIADLLDKYSLQGTFYIPATNKEHEVMNEKEVIELSRRFEIGGHTLNHIRINKVSTQLFDKEIRGGYHWLSDLLGEAPVSFCFPGGVYNQKAIEYTLKTGFKIIRTTELLNPWLNANNPVIPTTLQVFPHSTFTYYKHLLKNLKLKSLLLYLKSNSTSNSQKLMEYYLNYIQLNGGSFHLWGHSWEIEENNLWSTLEALLKKLSELPEFEYVNNKNIFNLRK